jgi:hypothetical protein
MGGNDRMNVLALNVIMTTFFITEQNHKSGFSNGGYKNNGRVQYIPSIEYVPH